MTVSFLESRDHAGRQRRRRHPVDIASRDDIEVDIAAARRPADADLPASPAGVAGEGLNHDIKIGPDRPVGLRADERAMALGLAPEPLALILIRAALR